MAMLSASSLLWSHSRMFLSLFLVSFILIMEISRLTCWNWKGSSGRYTFSWIFHLIKKFNPSIFGLVETRADDNRLDRFCLKLRNSWCWAAIVADGYSRGILMFWKNINPGFVSFFFFFF